MSARHLFKTMKALLATSTILGAQSVATQTPSPQNSSEPSTMNVVNCVPVGSDGLTSGQRNMNTNTPGPFAFTIYVMDPNGTDLIPYRSAPESWAPYQAGVPLIQTATAAEIYSNGVLTGVNNVRAIIFEDAQGQTYAFDTRHLPVMPAQLPTNVNESFLITTQTNGDSNGHSRVYLSFKIVPSLDDAMAALNNIDKLSVSTWINAFDVYSGYDPGTHFGAQYNGSPVPGTTPYPNVVQLFTNEDGKMAALLRRADGSIVTLPINKLDAMIVKTENGNAALLQRDTKGNFVAVALNTKLTA